MAQILIRGLKTDLVKRLKAQAKRHGRSLESEARRVLESSAMYTAEEARQVLEKWQKHWGNRKFDDSAKLIREDRQR